MIFEYFLIVLLILCVLIINNEKKEHFSNREKDKKEHFSNGNFKICDERDCGCLKLKTAPDGSCTEKNISNIPEVPNYEDKIFYNKRSINNIKYPKRRKYDILIFVGVDMKNKTTIFNQKIPSVLQTSFLTDYSIYSNDDASMELFEIFERAVDVVSYFDNKSKAFMKYLILNTNNISKDRKIMKTFGIDFKKVPAIYLYNESTKDLKRFLLKNNLEKQCIILERLLIFIADGDCGFLSYLNFLHDPYYGMKYEYYGKDEKWRPNLINGSNPLPPGTGMCSLIGLENVPENYGCKKLQL
tara:strand:+ start:92 stop:988 length:897 start_codon:yes stop_codon:yes gene_type:complete